MTPPTLHNVMCLVCYNGFCVEDQDVACPHEPIESGAADVEGIAPWIAVGLFLTALAIVAFLMWLGAQLEREAVKHRHPPPLQAGEREITITPPTGMNCYVIGNDGAEGSGTVTCRSLAIGDLPNRLPADDHITPNCIDADGHTAPCK